MILLNIIPSHKFASWVLDLIYRMLRGINLSPSARAVAGEAIYTVLVIILAAAIGWLVSEIVVRMSRLLVKHYNTSTMREMIHQHILIRCGRIVPPLIMLALLPWAFRPGPLINIITKALVIYTIVITALAVNAILTLVWERLNDRQNTHNLPLKGILNTAKGVVWGITVIAGVSFIMDKSPTYLLTGLGAFAAALMLIFKDPLLGLVAGIQLSQNDMLRVGDWIVVPNTPANGTVLDMSLTAVKVYNWDNTTVTLPPYSLVSSSFQNYRSMQKSGARRIARQVIFDVYSVRTLAAGEAETIAEKLPLLKDFIARVGKEFQYSAEIAGVNGTVDTNLGLFRAYMCLYINGRPEFNHSSFTMVRMMEPNGNGLPVQIYCFTSTAAWVAYEAIQSALFEHIAAVTPVFGLSLYNAESGADVDTVKVIDATPHDEVAKGASV